MAEQNQNKKALWIFPNFKESIDELPKSQRALVWQAVCEIGLGYDFDIKKCTTSQKMCIKMIYPLLKLRNIGGSIINGEKRNPDGKNGLNTCNKTIQEDNPYPNPQDNPLDNIKDNPLYKKEIEKEIEKEIKKENLNKYGEFKNVCLEEEYYEKLKLTFGEENLNRAIDKLDAWLDNPKQSKQRNHNHRGYFKSDSWVWEGKKTQSSERKDWEDLVAAYGG